MRRPWPWLVLAAALVAGGLAWALWPEPEPEPDVADDTGMGEVAEDQLLQEIGYLKGGLR